MALFKKKMNHQVIDGSCQNHLNVMRANYRENIITHKRLPKPLWLQMNERDELNVIYRDKDIIFRYGQIYYAYIVQANDLLEETGNKQNCPAQILYSTHPYAEKYPGFLKSIGSWLLSFTGVSENEVQEEHHQFVRAINNHKDRSHIEFSVSMPDPENQGGIIENIDVHLCIVMVFRKDIPTPFLLTGTYLPVLAAPKVTPAVLILPKEYWTATYYDM